MYSTNMKSHVLLLASLLLLAAGCGGTNLPFPAQETTDVLTRLAASDTADDSEIVPDLNTLNDILLEVFLDNYVPIPEEEIIAFNPVEAGSYSGADAFRWGYALPGYPANEDTVGAFVGRPASIDYDTLLQLNVNGPFDILLDYNFETYERTFDGSDTGFLAGTTDLLEGVNHCINTAPKGIKFEYTSDFSFRRIKDASLPQGEATIYYEQMRGEAVRVAGGYDAYLSYLRNVHIFIPYTDKLSWWVIAAWNKAGGSLFVFSAGGTSGDVANGIRHDYEDLEGYLADENLTCLPDDCE